MLPLPGRSPRPRGFTLVELLVVIGIIAVLTAILFPVVAGARGKARQTQCLSNVRQITQAMLVYAAEHENRLPPCTYERPASRYSLPWEPVINMNWWDVMLPMLRTESVLFCPAVKSLVPIYVMNQYLALPENGCLDYVSQPVDTFLIVEGLPKDNKHQLPVVAPCAFFVSPLLDQPYHHYGRMSASFVDGHVKCLGEEAFAMESPLWLAEK